MSSVPRIDRALIFSAVAGTALSAVAVAPLAWVATWPWYLRLGASLGALFVTLGAACVMCRRRSRQDATARRFVDLLVRLDYHELTSPDFETSFPSLGERNPWFPVFQRIRACLTDYGRRLQDLEQSRAGAEVRIRRLTHDYQEIAGILEGLSTPILAVNHYGDVTLANASARSLLKLEPIGENRVRIDAVLTCNTLLELLDDTRRRKSATQRMGEAELTDPEGKAHMFRIVCRTYQAVDAQSGEHGVVAVLTDVTELKGMQKRNAEFVSSVSHEMKTPLAGIKAYVELLADGDAEDEATKEEFLGVINGQVDRLQRLIDNLLNLARIEAGVVDVHKQPLSLNEVLTEAFNVVQPGAERKKIQLVSELSPLYLSVLADRDMLLQAAINLLSNAIKYTPDGGRVSLRSRADDGQVIVEVKDTGVGLAPEDCKRVFEKFYRVKKDRNMAAGTGLGLPLAKHIVEDVHGGSLTVESELGKGSTFRITMPDFSRS